MTHQRKELALIRIVCDVVHPIHPLKSLAADDDRSAVVLMIASYSILTHHPWPTGYLFHSPGCHFTYRVIGPCCRLYDREQLPWPCCRIQWRGKEPSWRRIGKRFVIDLATRNHPSYAVEILGQGSRDEPLILTLYTAKLAVAEQNWWHTKKKYEQPAGDSMTSEMESSGF